VPFVQCIEGPPRSVKERPSSNVAPIFCQQLTLLLSKRGGL